MSVCEENGVTHVEDLTTETHALREYVTQYHETHLAFIQRILAEEGILYYFRHEENRHVMVLTDNSVNCPDCEIDSLLEYNATSGGLTRGHYIDNFIWHERVMTSDFSQRDHYFKKPNHHYQSSHDAGEVRGLEQPLSMYSYPGRYKADAVGEDFARYQLEAYRKGAATGHGSGRCQYLTAGGCFVMIEHDAALLNRRYLVSSVTHSGAQPSALGVDSGAGPTYVHTNFSCLHDDVPWRAGRQIKPIVYGPQMAIVCGPEGEEIYCDEYGRVKVTFPWDRYSKRNDRSSCWIRVASNWAGGMWGHIAIPRIGQHVIVDYLEGDPDQPIIVGRAYNSVNPPPYSLPEHKTRMVIKSKTHKGDGFNELRFEDEKDREEVFIHAQKDKNVKVENNYSRRVNVNHVESIGHNKGTEVTNNQTNIVGGDWIVSVGPSKTGNITPSGADRSLYGIGNVSYSLGDIGKGAKGAGNAKISIEGNKQETIGATHIQEVMHDKQVDVKRDYLINTDGKLVIDVSEEIILKCGQSIIVLSPDGTISLNGKQLSHGFNDVIRLKSDIVKVN